jgi:hypothetical protein
MNISLVIGIIRRKSCLIPSWRGLLARAAFDDGHELKARASRGKLAT